MSTAPSPTRVQREPQLAGQTVVLIGGSAGIGRETARQLAALGWTVLVGARDAQLGHAAADELKADQQPNGKSDPVFPNVKPRFGP